MLATLADLAVDQHTLPTLTGAAISTAPCDGTALTVASLALATVKDDLAIELVPESLAERFIEVDALTRHDEEQPPPWRP
jgi:hypothetical protein